MKNRAFARLVFLLALTLLITGCNWGTKNKDEETSIWETYRIELYGVEIKHPKSWYAYGDASEFSSNTDVLLWRGFVPDFDSGKSMEEQELLALNVFKKNPESDFDAPKRYITKNRTDETWEPVTVNGYTGTKITNTTTNTVTDYVFERDEKIYVLYASHPDLFDKVLPTFKFFVATPIEKTTTPTEEIPVKPLEPESTPQPKTETKVEAEVKVEVSVEPRVIAVSGDEYSFSPSSITVNKGEKVKVVFTNIGQNRHNWVISGLNLSTRAIGSNETDTLEFTADATGSYEVFCSIAGHKEAGMVGSLTVK